MKYKAFNLVQLVDFFVMQVNPRSETVLAIYRNYVITESETFHTANTEPDSVLFGQLLLIYTDTTSVNVLTDAPPLFNHR